MTCEVEAASAMSHARIAERKARHSGGSRHIALAKVLLDGMALISRAMRMAHVSTSKKTALAAVDLPSGVPMTTTTGVFLYSVSAMMRKSLCDAALPSDSVGNTKT